MRARVRRAELVDAAEPCAAPGRRAAADRSQSDRASAAPRVLPGVRRARHGAVFRAGRRGGVRAAAASRGRDARGTQPRLAPRHDRARRGSCSGSSSRPARSTRSSSAPVRRSPRRTPGSSSSSSSVGRQHRRDRLEDRRRQRDAVGRADRPTRSSGSRPAATPSRQGCCLASASPGSSAQTAGAATTTSTPPGGSSAGPTCSETSPPTAKAWRAAAVRQRRPPDRTRALRRLGAYQHDGDRARLQTPDRAAPAKLRALLEHAARKSPRTKYHRVFAKNLLNRWPALWTFTHTDGVEPTNNHAERGLRGAVIYRKLSLGSQSEQASARSNDSSPPPHLPPPATLALRLPHRRPHRQHPRRPHPRARLTPAGPERLQE